MKVAQIVLMFVAALVISGCSDGCQNTELSSARSPDGRWRAVMFQRDCGATTGFSTQVSILPIGKKLKGAGNTFVADDDHGAAARSAWGGPWASLRWIASDQLEVSHDARAHVFKANPTVNSVQIVFNKVTSTPAG
jgi:hypothetical protein